MSKELFVSSTPHETKLALVEDDEVAELYFERDNEYSLAGSIYKGRVTRVLPGMQSAFVDVGLERDAFLYVSDFLEVPDEHGDIEEVAVSPIAAPGAQPIEPLPPRPAPVEAADEPDEDYIAAPPGQAAAPPSEQDQEGGGRWRGRRRRRGRRGRVEAKYAEAEGTAEPAQATQPAAVPRAEPAHAEPPRRTEPRPAPPRYQPIILPGESISKYANLTPTAPQPEPTAAEPAASQPRETWSEPQPETRAAFGAAVGEPPPKPASREGRGFYEEPEPVHSADVFTSFEPPSEPASSIAAGAPEQPPAGQEEGTAAPPSDSRREPRAPNGFAFQPGVGALEEEVIDEEEAEFTAPGQQLQQAYEQLEEETLDSDSDNGNADDDRDRRDDMIAAGRQVIEAVEDAAIQSSALAGYEADDLEEFEEEDLTSSQAAAEYHTRDHADDEENDDADEENDDQDEDEEEGDEEGARAEVRGPASTAGFQQRPQRAARPERRSDRGRGRRGPGGRRMGRGREQNRPTATISELLKEGQEILVQIAKEPIGKKGARITSHIALPGRFLVYMPTVNHMGVSRKISSDEERQRLKRILLSERDGHGGFIVRTAAEGADEGELRADIRFLKNLWHEIRSRAESGPSPALIYHDLNLVERILRDQVNQNFSRIWVDTESEYERIVRFMSRFQPALVKRVKLYTKETPLFEEFGIQEEIDKALKSKVWLKSGGYIVINQTEALVAIDINTGKYVGKTARLEDTIVKTNVDAIKEIVRQIRLRDLGGIIVIDFIDMDERRNRQKVMQALEEALQSDRAPSKVLQFNDFGLVAITRKRVKQSLERTLGEPCNYCTGTGLVKSVTTVCNEIFVEMRKLSKQMKGGDVLLRAHPEVAKALKGAGARWLQEMEELTGRNIIVKSDPMLHQEQFDIN